MDSSDSISEQGLYDSLNKYREQCRTSALTTFDIQVFASANELFCVNPEMILKCIVLGNACSWSSYEVACKHYGACKESIDNLVQGIVLENIL